jgi:hypothetical protein
MTDVGPPMLHIPQGFLLFAKADPVVTVSVIKHKKIQRKADKVLQIDLI